MNKDEITEIGTEIIKKGRPLGSTDIQPRKSRSEVIGNADLSPSDMSRYIKQARSMISLPEIDISDINQVKDRLEWYFTECEKGGLKPTMMGMCNALGVSRQTMYNWGHGEYRSGTHLHVIRKYLNMLEEIWEMEMVENKINPVVGIFLGKNHFGYADTQVLELAPKDPLGDRTDTKSLEERYLESVVDDTEENIVNSVVD